MSKVSLLEAYGNGPPPYYECKHKTVETFAMAPINKARLESKNDSMKLTNIDANNDEKIHCLAFITWLFFVNHDSDKEVTSIVIPLEGTKILRQRNLAELLLNYE
ncbi:unnamed protein product [Cylindrotheca closterium]|uniref:Uncharacterized protein n=1 Tax=Cylindrotheca closterium TaxID=2856 RepID=A0AAD2CIB2_9STRA|nr:unnamed protein product [Cylindrotheca closterium]